MSYCALQPGQDRSRGDSLRSGSRPLAWRRGLASSPKSSPKSSVPLAMRPRRGLGPCLGSRFAPYPDLDSRVSVPGLFVVGHQVVSADRFGIGRGRAGDRQGNGGDVPQAHHLRTHVGAEEELFRH